jgi:hypothetical protein
VYLLLVLVLVWLTKSQMGSSVSGTPPM